MPRKQDFEFISAYILNNQILNSTNIISRGESWKNLSRNPVTFQMETFMLCDIS